MDQIQPRLDVAGQPLEAGDLVLYVSSRSSVLILGRILQTRERNVIIQSLHIREDAPSGIDFRFYNGLVKLTDPAYADAPDEWLRVLFPNVD